jgi:hypothetical protein
VGFLLLRRACSGLVIGGNADQASQRTTPWGTQWGQLNKSPAANRALRAFVVGDWDCFGDPLLGTIRPSGGLACALRRFGCTIVTWLILPVVICLSQRLSHACLSISNYTVKLRMAH